MPFAYPTTVHVRTHGPTGYTDYRSYKPWVRDEFGFRCVYCLFRETWYPNGQASFAVEHARSQHVATDLVTNYTNLLYSCNRCNSWKQIAELLDPTREALGSHLRVDHDGSITHLTDEGLRLIRVLHLDGDDETRWRHRMLDLLRRALEEPVDMGVLKDLFGFPEDLPDLAALRPPGGNVLSGGVRDCHYERRRRGVLPDLLGVSVSSTT